MKILIIHNKYQQSGGEDASVEAQVQLFHEKGHEVILYSRNNDEIEHFNFFQKLSFLFSTFCSLRTIRDINKIIISEQPNIAHVHNVFPLITPSIYWALHRKNIPIVQTIHNFRFLCPNGLFYVHDHLCELCKMGNTLHAIRWRCYRNNRLLSALYAKVIGIHRLIGTFKLISGFLVLNSFTSNKLIESGIITGAKIKIIPNFLSSSMPEVKGKERLFEVVYIGRLSVEKGLQVLINSLRVLPDLRLRIMGTGPQELDLKEQAADMGNRVIFEGFISGPHKFKILSSAQIVVIPSLCYEQFPVTALEAMATGTPILASNLGGLPSIIKEGENGLLFEAGNEQDLAEKIRVLVDNPDLAHQMGLNGRKMVENLFSAEAHYSSLMGFYQELIQKN